MSPLSKKIILVILVIFTLQILFAGAVLAAEKPKLRLQVGIPGTDYDKAGQEYSIDIADYIGAIYNYVLSIVGIVAIIMIAVGGVIWLMARGDANKVTQAKDYIVSALIGLFLVLGSWLILNTVNPNLINLKVPEIAELLPAEYVCCEITPDVTDTTGLTTAQLAIGIIERVNQCLPGERQVKCPETGIKGVAEKTCNNNDNCSEGEVCVLGAGPTGAGGLCSGGNKGEVCTVSSDNCKTPYKCIDKANDKMGIGACEIEGELSAGSSCPGNDECASKICESGRCKNGTDGDRCVDKGKCADGFECVVVGNYKACRPISDKICEWDVTSSDSHGWSVLTPCPSGFTCILNNEPSKMEGGRKIKTGICKPE